MISGTECVSCKAGAARPTWVRYTRESRPIIIRTSQGRERPLRAYAAGPGDVDRRQQLDWMPPGWIEQQGRMAPVRDDFATYCFAVQLPDPLALAHPEEQLISAPFP